MTAAKNNDKNVLEIPKTNPIAAYNLMSPPPSASFLNKNCPSKPTAYNVKKPTPAPIKPDTKSYCE